MEINIHHILIIGALVIGGVIVYKVLFSKHKAYEGFPGAPGAPGAGGAGGGGGGGGIGGAGGAGGIAIGGMSANGFPGMNANGQSFLIQDNMGGFRGGF